MRVRARRGWAAGLFAVAAGVAGLGPMLAAVTAEPAWAFFAPVRIVDTEDGARKGFAFSPPTKIIRVGDGVSWFNATDTKHTVTSDSAKKGWDSDEVGPGDAYGRRFDQVGEYPYRCRIHPKLKGVIVVEEERPAAPTTTSPAPTTTTSPAPAPTTSSAPASTTSTAPATTTTGRPPATTTSTAPATTTSGRAPAGVKPPPVPSSAAAPPPTLATSSTTTTQPGATTTQPAATTTQPAATTTQPAATVPPGPAPSGTVPATGDGLPTAVGPTGADRGADPATVALVGALIAVGLYGVWTLIRVRPGRI